VCRLSPATAKLPGFQSARMHGPSWPGRESAIHPPGVHARRSSTARTSRSSKGQFARPVRRPASVHGTDDASSPPHHAPPSPPNGSSPPPRWHAPSPAAPVRKSSNQSWCLFRPCDRVRPHVLTPCWSLRRGEALLLLLLAARHAALPRLRLRGKRNHGPPHDQQRRRPGLGRTPCARLPGRRCAVTSAATASPACPGRPADTAGPARSPMHRIMRGDRWRHRASPVTPTDPCLCAGDFVSVSICLSVLFIFFFSLDGRSLIHRS
jgi:hypothetical protein